MTSPDSSSPHTNRRHFVKGASTVAATAAAASWPTITLGQDDRKPYKIGLIGCGGRGTGAAAQAIAADPYVQMHAMGDLFGEHLEVSRKSLAANAGGRGEVEDKNVFVGWDAYEKVLASGVDLVILTTPPGFRPLHLQAAVDAGKHVFCEKPVAVDPVGVRKVLAACRKAEAQGSFVVSGLQWRYDPLMQDTVKRIQDGQIGRIAALESTRYAQGVGKLAERQDGWTDFEYQIRNWYYYSWVSGDFVVEQLVHELDKMAWIAGEYPKMCSATGGRITRTEAPKYGHVFDHFNMMFDFEKSGIRLFAGTTHQPGTRSIRRDIAHGATGQCNIMKYTFTGEQPHRVRRPDDMRPNHQLEHDECFRQLRKGGYINNGEYMSHSTLMGIMGREAAYTGQAMDWDELLASDLDLSPPSFDWNQDLPEPPVAVPGTTVLDRDYWTGEAKA